MIGRFLFGAFSGVALVVSGMVAGSALFPMRGPSQTPPEETVTPTVTEGAEPAAPETDPLVVAEAEVPAVEPDPVDVAPEPSSTSQTAAQPEVTEAPAALPEPTAEAEAADTSAVAEVAVPATPEAPAALPAPTEDPTVASADNGSTTTAPEAASEPTPEAASADAPVQPAEATQPAAEPEPVAEPAPEAATLAEPETAIEQTPEAAPEPEATGEDVVVAEVTEDGDAESSTFAPSKGFASDEALTTESETAAGDDSAADTATEAPTSTQPMALYAAKFDNPEAKPVLAIVLIDTGAADLDRAALAALPFPVSFALDPMDPATPDRAALYRAAGREVIMLATGIAEGSQASDIEVAFQSMSQRMPEAVAVMDLSEPVFQDNRPLASLVVPVIGDEGRGVLSWDKGLNAADQVARREDVASAVIFRDLAMGGGDAAAAKRTLDRAVFKAGQDGRVVVAGEVTPELIAGLLEWSVEGRAGAVALGPLTAVLQVD